MPSAVDNAVFVFIDESGNFDFTERGTRFFVMSAFVTETPLRCASGLAQLTYEYLARSLSDQIPFHASENSTGTRLRVIGALCDESHECFTHNVVVDKYVAATFLNRPEVFYAQLGLTLARILVESVANHDKKLVLLFDAALTSRQRNAFLKIVKTALRAQKREFVIAFRAISHDVNGQRADISAWSTFRRFEQGDATWSDMLPGRKTVTILELN